MALEKALLAGYGPDWNKNHSTRHQDTKALNFWIKMILEKEFELGDKKTTLNTQSKTFWPAPAYGIVTYVHVWGTGGTSGVLLYDTETLILQDRWNPELLTLASCRLRDQAIYVYTIQSLGIKRAEIFEDPLFIPNRSISWKLEKLQARTNFQMLVPLQWQPFSDHNSKMRDQTNFWKWITTGKPKKLKT